jgi:hypothetical protein
LLGYLQSNFPVFVFLVIGFGVGVWAPVSDGACAGEGLVDLFFYPADCLRGLSIWSNLKECYEVGVLHEWAFNGEF